jgi:hypothetical protein
MGVIVAYLCLSHNVLDHLKRVVVERDVVNASTLDDGECKVCDEIR